MTGTRYGRVWLALSAHFHALRTAPRAWADAAWWRLRGKRLRAHCRFAPLLGTAPGAYALWMERHEMPPPGNVAAGPPIVALIGGEGDRAATLCSLAEQGVLAMDMAQAADLSDADDAAWLMPLAAGDVLAPGAIAAWRTAIAGAGANARIVYADDDLLDAKGRRTAPHFKPDWNGELFRHFDYLTGACVVRVTRAELESVAAFDDGMQRLVRLAAAEGEPVHLRHVLLHRRSRPQPCLPGAMAVSNADLPPVTVIVPTRNRVDLLRTCLDGLAATDYPDIETIVVDNGSDDPETLTFLDALDPARGRVLRHPGPFNFSEINNRAAQEAQGALLCLLNNDIEVMEPDWLRTMAAQALRPDVGAVGAQLLYPDGRIQHAGVVMGVGGGAAHAHRLLRPDDEGYFRRHALPQFVSAVTAACLVVRRDRFLAVGGLDEQDFPVAFNDVDLCMKLNQMGWQSFYEPRATLIHHESVSRGFDRDPVGAARLGGELAALKRRWGTDSAVDPFHHPQLSSFSEQFVVRL